MNKSNQPAYGQQAVEKAIEHGALSAAEVPLHPELETKDQYRILGARTFVNTQDGWVDTTFDPEQMETVKVAFLSDDYFILARSRAELAAAFALGERVIAIVDGTAYEVVASESNVPAIDLSPASISTTDQPKSTPTSTTMHIPNLEPTRGVESPARRVCLGALLPVLMVSLVGMLYYHRDIY